VIGNMSVNIDINQLLKRAEQMERQGMLLLKSEVAKGCNPYVPFDHGMLAKSVEPSIYTDDPYLIWDTPYAAAQYYMYEHKSTDVHPNAQRYWFEAFKAADIASTIQKVKDGVKF